MSENALNIQFGGGKDTPLLLLIVSTALDNPVDENMCSGFATEVLPLLSPKFHCKSVASVYRLVNCTFSGA